MNNMQALLQLASASFDSKIWMPEVRFLTEPVAGTVWYGTRQIRCCAKPLGGYLSPIVMIEFHPAVL